jgi:hypothetical protein
MESEAVASTVGSLFHSRILRRMIRFALGLSRSRVGRRLCNLPQGIVENYPDRTSLSTVPAGDGSGEVAVSLVPGSHIARSPRQSLKVRARSLSRPRALVCPAC